MSKDARRGKLIWRSKKACHGRKPRTGKRKGQKKHW